MPLAINIRQPLQLCPFLRLPLELRQQIYNYILPTTITIPTKGANGVVWQRGFTSILATNHQIHEECAELMYGHSMFVISITYDKIMFQYQWLVLPSRLAPNRAYPFLEHFPQKSIRRIKNYTINIRHEDSYTGWIKYNCGGPGLTEGVRRNVQKLVEVLGTAGDLHKVRIHLSDGSNVLSEIRKVPVRAVQLEKNVAVTQIVLDPLRQLRGVRQITITGTVLPEYVAAIESEMASAARVNSVRRAARTNREWTYCKPGFSPW